MEVNIHVYLFDTLKNLRIEIFIGLVVFFTFNWLRRVKNLPPGPYGLPVLGYLPFLGSEAYRTLHNLTDKYGPIFSFYLGRKLVVVLGNFDVVKEALSNNKIMDRPKNPPNDLLPHSTSLSVSNGLIWKEQRKFSVQALRELGMAKSKMEDFIQAQLNMLMEEIDSKKGNPMNLDQLLLPTVSNVILTMLIGKPLDFKDKDRLFLNKMLQTMVVFFRPTRLHAYFPSLRYWMASLKIWGYDQAEYYMDKFEKFIVEQIEHQKKTFDNHNVQNYIDSYLLTLKTKVEKVSSFSEKMLKGNFQSFFSAGSTPSRATLEWCLMSMLRYPEVQKAIHDELDAVLGKDRRPTWDDHLALPYTISVIYEVMRHNTIVPISMLRCTSSRTKIAGYDIPKGTVVMTNIWGVHHDPKDWDDPFSFKPERFIKDGKAVKPQAFIPFSYGRRNCPGEDMAIIMVFLFFTSLMQRYSITPPDTDLDIKQVVGVAKLVILDNVCLKIRC